MDKAEARRPEASRLPGRGSFRPEPKQFLASFVTSALLAFFMSVVMTLQIHWSVFAAMHELETFGLLRLWHPARTDLFPLLANLFPAMLAVIAIVSWAAARNYGLKLRHFVFPGFAVVWAAQVLMYPGVPAGFGQPLSFEMRLAGRIVAEPGVPMQAFLRAVFVLLLQALVLLATKALAWLWLRVSRPKSRAESAPAAEGGDKGGFGQD